jgi:Pyruvate:ferredoxin oxidoreductase and related 2-oxoacid:ferredoxin oxidoreductases, alpha subunit
MYRHHHLRPGYSLKQEAIGLAVMAEIPLVVVNVQRGGPSTGQPTKAEQGDLMTTIFGSHGDAPKVVMAPATIEECFYSVITARKIAESFNTVVVILSDAALATSQQPYNRPQFNEAWLAPPIDQSAVPAGAKPYDWDPNTGIARRFIPASRAACTPSPAWPTTGRATSPTTRTSTRKACACAA